MTGRPAFLGGFTLATQLTVAGFRYSESKNFKLPGEDGACAFPHRVAPQETRKCNVRKKVGLTWNRYVSFERAALGIGKIEHHPFAVMAAEDSEILADALLSSALGLGLGHAAQEDQFGA